MLQLCLAGAWAGIWLREPTLVPFPGLTAWYPCASGLGWELLRSLNTLGTEAWLQAAQPRECHSGVQRGTLQKPSAWDTQQWRGVSQQVAGLRSHFSGAVLVWGQSLSLAQLTDVPRISDQ